MSHGLFREEALEAQRGHWLGAINLATPLVFAWWALLAVTLAGAALAFLIFGHYTRRAEVAGQLRPNAGMLTLSAKTTGTVTRSLIQEGDEVEAGQPLVEVSANLVSASMGDTHAMVSSHLRTQMAQVRDTLSNLKLQTEEQSRDLQSRVGALQAQLRQIDDQLTLQRKQTRISANFVDRIRPLVERGVVSSAQFNQYQSGALTDQVNVKSVERQRFEISSQLSNLKTQLAQLPLDDAIKANQLRADLAKIDAQLAESESARSTVLHAPHAGVVSALLVKPGQDVRTGQPLLSILPQGSKLEAQLLVPSSAIGFIEPGRRVVLRYQAYPYQKFGQQYGKVTQVSRSALSPAEASSLLGQDVPAPMYRVLVALDRQSIVVYGKTEPLKPGMTLSADILLDRRRLWQWVFEPLYGLRQQIEAD